MKTSCYLCAIVLGLLLASSLTQLSFAADSAAANSLHSAQSTSSTDQNSPGPLDIIQGTNPAIPWPMFHQQPSHIGFNGFERTISKTNVQNLQLQWVGIMGDIVDTSSPAVVNGIVYVGSFDGRLYAFKANGCGQQVCQPLWSGATGNAILSSPAVTNGTVFVGSEDHNFYAFSAGGCGHADCPPLWTGTTNGAIDSGPVVTPTVVYVGSEDHNFYAFPTGGCGQATCAPLWSVPTGGGINSSPALVNNILYFGSQDGKLYAVDARGCGRQVCAPLWTAQVGSIVFGSSPAVSGGIVYIASFNEINSTDSRLYAFNANGCGQMTCQPLWTAPAGDFVVSSPAVAKGIVYVLAIMSIWTLSVAIKKWWDLRQAQGETRKFAPEFSQFLEEDNLTEAVTLADKYKKSHVARVLGGALTEIRPLIQDGSVTVGDINSAERAIEREMLMTITDLKRGLGIMATVGATAPFV
ncbi:MAG: outer membrane protein assembly factor BamB family protein, partial [Terriglobales bacterium]